MPLRTSIALLLLSVSLVQADPAGTRHAVVIGVNDYQGRLPRLRYAENDAREMGRILAAQGAGFGVLVMTHDQPLPPTAANVRQALAGLFANKTAADTVLVAISGHGVELPARDPDGRGGEKRFPFFCPSDARFEGVEYATGRSDTLINLNDVVADMGRCQAGAKLLLLDVNRDEAAGRYAGVSFLSAPANVGVLFACRPGQRAYESVRLRKGVFFHYLIEGLDGRAADGAGLVTWGRLVGYVVRRVPLGAAEFVSARAEQTPYQLDSPPATAAVLARYDTRPAPPTQADRLYREANDLISGANTQIDHYAAVRKSREASQLNHAPATALLALMYADGLGLPRDERRARALAERALPGVREAQAHGRTDAYVLLGGMYERGLGVPLDKKRAYEMYMAAADRRDVAGMRNCGWCYLEGIGVAQNHSAARPWLEAAAAQGDAPAMTALGHVLSRGRGVRKDHKAAFARYAEASAKGEPGAMLALAGMHERGRGVGAKNPAEAERLRKKAAEAGSLDAMYELGLLAARATPPDEKQALAWFRKAADLGHAGAMNEIGRVYYYGTGEPKNPREAARWYLRAAGLGHAAAMASYASCCDTGTGVGRDYRVAEAWWLKAAEAGEPRAMRALEAVYSDGIRRSPDVAKARYWGERGAEREAQLKREAELALSDELDDEPSGWWALLLLVLLPLGVIYYRRSKPAASESP